MSKNIVILSGSPRKNENTDKLVAAFIDGAKSADKNVTLFRVADMSIGGCLGCKYCLDNKGVCSQNDDMTQIRDVIQRSDTIVFASPVYYAGVSAQLKLAIDRTYALWDVETAVKQAALLMTCEDASTAEGAIVMYKIILDFEEWGDAGIIIASGLEDEKTIDGHEALEQAYKLGQEI